MIWGFLRAFGLFLLRVPMILLGLPVVWVALRDTRVPYDTGMPFSQFPQHGIWYLMRLPKWALWWDNAFDGMLGDKRGWWANDCKGEHTSRYHMWRWAALRNPANYFSRNVCGVDVSTLRIAQVGGTLAGEGSNGFMLLKGMAAGGKVYPRFYCEYRIKGEHGLMIDIGWKIKLSHNDTPAGAAEKDRIKGIVFVISPWKELA
jgi:hypothetical protein